MFPLTMWPLALHSPEKSESSPLAGAQTRKSNAARAVAHVESEASTCRKEALARPYWGSRLGVRGAACRRVCGRLAFTFKIRELYH
jgi:hypothetical protein